MKRRCTGRGVCEAAGISWLRRRREVRIGVASLHVHMDVLGGM
jgi:hypothetical protein